MISETNHNDINMMDKDQVISALELQADILRNIIIHKQNQIDIANAERDHYRDLMKYWRYRAEKAQHPEVTPKRIKYRIVIPSKW